MLALKGSGDKKRRRRGGDCSSLPDSDAHAGEGAAEALLQELVVGRAVAGPLQELA